MPEAEPPIASARGMLTGLCLGLPCWVIVLLLVRVAFW